MHVPMMKGRHRLRLPFDTLKGARIAHRLHSSYNGANPNNEETPEADEGQT